MEEVIEERRNSMRCYHDAAILKNASRGRLGLSPLRPPANAEDVRRRVEAPVPTEAV
jgi:hypothetical protein